MIEKEREREKVKKRARTKEFKRVGEREGD